MLTTKSEHYNYFLVIGEKGEIAKTLVLQKTLIFFIELI